MIVYTFFRQNKARRAYDHALRLQDMGIETADPVAYIEMKKGGLFHTGYFMSRYLPYQSLADIRYFAHEEREKIIGDLAVFTSQIHQRGVLHHDFNISNILFYEEHGRYRFALIDINRIKFRKPSQRDCIKELRRLGMDFVNESLFIQQYTERQHWSKEWFTIGLHMFRKAASVPSTAKHWIKDTIKELTTPKENTLHTSGAGQ